MYIPKAQIENRLKEGDRVLDIGSWNDVFPRANVIIDVNPYETRKNKFPDQREYFTRDSWLQSDVNKIETWAKFKDKEFDFAICSHLLEDVRDPLFVCEQLIRVCKSGYIEVPTRYRECSRALANDTVSGYDHHRWLVDVIDEALVFTAKLHWAHTIDYLTDEKRRLLNFSNFHYFGVFWEDSFSFVERCPKGELLEGANLIYQFDRLDISRLKEISNLEPAVGVGSLKWVDQFLLPVELEGQTVVEEYKTKYKEFSKESGNLVVMNSELKEHLERTQRLNECLELQAFATRASLRDVLVSRSWRLTAPLRQLMTSMSNMKRAFWSGK